MALQHIFALGHGGITYFGGLGADARLVVPGGVHLVFYTPPGRALDAFAAQKIYKSLRAPDARASLAGIEPLKAHLSKLSAQLKVGNKEKSMQGIDPTAGVFEFQLAEQWPLVITGHGAPEDYVYNYLLKGPQPGEIEHVGKATPHNLFFGIKTISAPYTKESRLKDQFASNARSMPLQSIIAVAQNFAQDGNECAIHWLACRAHLNRDVDLFNEPGKVIVQSLSLKDKSFKHKRK